MPVIFSEQVDIATLEAGDFQVTLENGAKVGPDCVTPAPADDIELRTILGSDFGSIDNEPANVEVIGNLFSMDHTINYKGNQVGYRAGQRTSLVLAESVDKDSGNSETSQCPSFRWWQWLSRQRASDPRCLERRGY